MQVDYLGHLRAPYFPIRNPRIPTAVNEQRYLNDSMISCDALMTYFYGRGVAGLSPQPRKGCSGNGTTIWECQRMKPNYRNLWVQIKQVGAKIVSFHIRESLIYK